MEQQATDTAVRAPSPRRRHWRRYRFPLLLVAPTVIVLAGLVIYPLYTVAEQSLLEYNLLTPGEFVGWDNYTYLVLRDPFFWTIVRNTVVWTLITVGAEVVLGLALALSLNQATRARGLFRGLVTLPWVVPTVTAALIWASLYDQRSGPFTAIVEWMGVDGVGWLSDIDIALFSVAAVAIWKFLPLMVVGLLAGLQAIPGERYEAAAIDGANRWQTLCHVTVPGLLPILATLATLSTMWRWAEFDIIHIMTRGGPANATNLLSFYAYERAVVRLEVGMASALSILSVLFIIWFIVAFVRRTVQTNLEA